MWDLGGHIALLQPFWLSMASDSCLRFLFLVIVVSFMTKRPEYPNLFDNLFFYVVPEHCGNSCKGNMSCSQILAPWWRMEVLPHAHRCERITFSSCWLCTNVRISCSFTITMLRECLHFRERTFMRECESLFSFATCVGIEVSVNKVESLAVASSWWVELGKCKLFSDWNI